MSDDGADDRVEAALDARKAMCPTSQVKALNSLLSVTLRIRGPSVCDNGTGERWPQLPLILRAQVQAIDSLPPATTSRKDFR